MKKSLIVCLVALALASLTVTSADAGSNNVWGSDYTSSTADTKDLLGSIRDVKVTQRYGTGATTFWTTRNKTLMYVHNSSGAAWTMGNIIIPDTTIGDTGMPKYKASDTGYWNRSVMGIAPARCEAGHNCWITVHGYETGVTFSTNGTVAAGELLVLSRDSNAVTSQRIAVLVTDSATALSLSPTMRALETKGAGQVGAVEIFGRR